MVPAWIKAVRRITVNLRDLRHWFPSIPRQCKVAVFPRFLLAKDPLAKWLKLTGERSTKNVNENVNSSLFVFRKDSYNIWRSSQVLFLVASITSCKLCKVQGNDVDVDLLATFLLRKLYPDMIHCHSASHKTVHYNCYGSFYKTGFSISCTAFCFLHAVRLCVFFFFPSGCLLLFCKVYPFQYATCIYIGRLLLNFFFPLK